MDSLSEDLHRLDLQDPKVVTFEPSSLGDGRNTQLDPIPPYLFRVFDSSSPGESNKIWIKSKDAVRHHPNAKIDIFKRRDRVQAARSLWGHLRWKGFPDDNLMSWTSSLLFAIQYILYRHNSQWARPSYTDIKLCVLDTRTVAQGAFVRDIDLIKAFAPFDADLREFAKMRCGKYYFGEYLSQGALNIAGHNTIVSAQDMLDKGLLLLRPEFNASLENSRCGWANDVVAMYDMLEQDLAKPEPRQKLQLVRQALHVAQLFGRNHRLFVAVSLVAIVPGQINAETTARAFREANFSKETERLQTSQTCVYQGMSDLIRFREVQGMVHAECYQYDLQGWCRTRLIPTKESLVALSSAQHYVTQADDAAWNLRDECPSDHRQPTELAFVFWTVLTSLGLLVWYFPLWHMGISGYEAAVMSTVSPFMLGIPLIRRLSLKYPYVLHLLMGICGLSAYLVQSPEGRLGQISLAVWVGCLAWVATWYRERGDSKNLEARISAWLIGLIASSVAKYAFQTNNPLWPVMHEANGGWNKTGVFFFSLAISWILYRQKQIPEGTQQLQEKPKGSSALAGLGIGGLVFGLHSLLSDSSTLIIWVWEGYPVRGPMAVPHGAWTIFTMGVGLIVGLFYPNVAWSWTFFGIGSVGAAVLTCFSHWFGYYGGLALTFYLCAATPFLITNATRFPPARTFAFGFFSYNIMVLFHVWVVAYAFVPGGPLVREHTDWVMATTMIMIGCGVFSSLQNSGSPAKQTGFQPPPNPAGRKQRSYYIYILLLLQLLSASIAYLRFPSYDYTPHHPDNKLITAGIWTIHFSIDDDLRASEKRMEFLLKGAELDLIGLLESDQQKIIMGNRDSTQYLAEELGMWADYGPGPNKHTWGCALLSRFPIVNSTHHLLPSPHGELAPAIHATVDAHGEMVDVFVFHSGQEEDPEDRRLQTEYLSDLMGSTPRPSILLSYLVTKPQQGNYNTYVSDRSGMKDIDRSDWDRWCEYILYKGLKKTAYARLSRSTITDTELQVAKFQVGQPDGTGEFISEDQVPEDLRFPQLFRGEGVRGHRYHVFNEPRYFA